MPVSNTPPTEKFPEDGRRRVVFEGVAPEIEGGRYPVKRVIGEKVIVEADIFADGHDEISAWLLFRHQSEMQWRKTPMQFLLNDRWRAAFTVEELGIYHYSLAGRIEHFSTWKHDLDKKYQAGRFLEIERLIGVEFIQEAADRAGDKDALLLRKYAERIRDAKDDAQALAVAREEELAELMAIHHNPELVTHYERQLSVAVEPEKALFGAWYEFFPRSAPSGGKGHGTFRDCEQLLPEIARMGFDIIYLPPIHPIGLTHRKGKNNATIAREEDPGSPWAIGSPEGGHTETHPKLGTIEDFERLLAQARGYDIDVALDIAFQASPEHPFVRQHPDWFRWRPDGTVQYAENPPKKYEDIIPFDFESNDWKGLWRGLRDIFLYWIEKGVTIFRVDNPHTKSFGFWEWTIAEIRKDHPEVIFLSEAFTRPKVMFRLAKLGFSQSYTYFSWRNTKRELEQYLTELCTPPAREFFRPNFWPNTPDILPEILQYGGKPAFLIRHILASTLSASYGIYGPAFEMFVNQAIPGKEEYLDSEKYEIKNWDWDDPENMRDLIARINQIRRENPALQTTWNVNFCQTDNDNILCYTKISEDRENLLLIAVSLDPFNRQAGNIQIPLDILEIPAEQPFLLHNLLDDTRQICNTEWNRVELHPGDVPAIIYRVNRRLRREQDFDYFM